MVTAAGRPYGGTMMSQLTYLVTAEQNADRVRAAESQRQAAAVSVERPTREIRLPRLRRTRTLLSARKRPYPA
jgi:hypothetical protein